MKGTFEFDLNDPDDVREHRLHTKAKDLAIAVWDYDQYLRGRLKYEELSELEYKSLDEARTKLRECLYDYGVSLDEITN